MLDTFIFVVFGAGVLMFLSPCIFPLLPVYFSILEKDNKKIRNTFLFILGLSTAFMSLGFSFGIIGQYIYTDLVRKIASIIIVIMGLQQLEILKFSFMNKTKTIQLQKKYNSSALESFMLGFTFSLGWTPCVGPILSTVLIYASESSSAIYGIFLLAIFVLGFTMPFLTFTIFYERLSSKIGIIKNNLENIKKISAIVIILMGLALYFDRLNQIVGYLNSFGTIY